MNVNVINKRIEAYICPSARRVQPQTASNVTMLGVGTLYPYPSPAPIVFPHNYPAAGTLHGWAGCGRHGNNQQNGVFALRWGILEETGGPADPQIKLSSVTDGTSSTMAFSETAQGIPGTAGLGIDLRGRGWADPYYCSTWYSIGPLSTPNSRVSQYPSYNNSNAVSYHEGGVHVLFLDGSARFISENIDGNTWHRIGTPQTDDVPGEI
jgi:prepilin-type processing-associated H-X9-DG protein